MSNPDTLLRRLIAVGDLQDWKGLSTLYVSGLTSTFPRDSDWTGSAKLGRIQMEASYFWANVPGTGQKLRAWFEGEIIILLDFECSETFRARPEDLAGLLPEVPIALDTWNGTLHMPKSELVFPQHGLAAYINREMKSVWHLALFTPQTLSNYVDNLRLDMQVRRHPSEKR